MKIWHEVWDYIKMIIIVVAIVLVINNVPPQFCRDGCMLFYRGGCMLRTFAGLPGRMHAVLPDRTFAVLRGGCTPFCRGERSLFCRTGRIDRNISYLCPGSRPVFLAPHPLRCTPLSAHRDACPA